MYWSLCRRALRYVKVNYKIRINFVFPKNYSRLILFRIKLCNKYVLYLFCMKYMEIYMYRPNIMRIFMQNILHQFASHQRVSLKCLCIFI